VAHTLVHARQIKAIRKMARVKVPRKRRTRIPRQIYPRAIEREYAAAIAGLTSRAWRQALQQLTGELPAILEAARQSRADSGVKLRNFAGLTVVIENPKGSVRHWYDSHARREGQTEMLWDYGFLDGYDGADHDEVDVYLGPNQDAEHVYVVEQMKAPAFTEYDEDKVMLGFNSEREARVAYIAQYDNPRFLGSITEYTMPDFLAALKANPSRSLARKRMDSDEGKKAKRLLDKAKDQMKATVGADQVEAVGHKFAKLTSSHQRKMIGKQVRAALGVDVTLKDKGLTTKLQHFADENSALISSLQDKVHGEVSKIVMRAITEGQSNQDVAALIEKRFDVAESHARLIARDQIGKLYGQLNVARQKELGVKRFIWRSVGDERVRDEHEEREIASDPAEGGTPYYYDDPPDGELPGVPIQCRCTAEPVFDFDEEDDDDEPVSAPKRKIATQLASDDEEDDEQD
jgi:SPP1 gp7 family putative phage head morphogenesis protein